MQTTIYEPCPKAGRFKSFITALGKNTAKKNSPFLQWIRAQHGDSIRLISIEDVLLFKSSDKYTLVITSKKESLIRKTIKELDPEKFWKIHRGTIINVSAISKISKSISGKCVVKINDYD
ncbi:MAG: LytTR family transcriptional regulator [Desulfobacula sp.]|nr:LytTR family transcriptional regulator [Desulfobacula sp.]